LESETAKGRTRYHGAWREPKLLIIYVVDAHGKQEKSFKPIIDGCFKGPDGIFHLLKGYLEFLHIQKADKILWLIADSCDFMTKTFTQFCNNSINSEYSVLRKLLI